MSIKRGHIYYIAPGAQTGNEMRADRPGIVVSSDRENGTSGTAEVVFLTTAQKKEMRTHVLIRATGRDSTALCEQITTVAEERIGTHLAICSDAEMAAIEEALRQSLALPGGTTDLEKDNAERLKTAQLDNQKLKQELRLANAETELLREMYESLLSLLERVIKV